MSSPSATGAMCIAVSRVLRFQCLRRRAVWESCDRIDSRLQPGFLVAEKPG